MRQAWRVTEESIIDGKYTGGGIVVSPYQVKHKLKKLKTKRISIYP